MNPTENTTTAETAAKLEAEATTARKENFARLFNPKLAILLEKRDEIKRMADRPLNFYGVITQAHVDKVEAALEAVVGDIMAALYTLRDYTPPAGDESRPLRKKPEFDLFDM